MPEPEDLVTVSDAARRVHVSPPRVHGWIVRGQLNAQQGARGLLVSASAVQVLAEAAAPPSDPRGEYVTASVAARMPGVANSTIRHWVKTGKVSTQAGLYGRLVRLADVLAYAASRG